MTIWVSGGCGFIGSTLVRTLLRQGGVRIISVDKMTYAANRGVLREFRSFDSFRHVELDLVEGTALEKLIDDEAPDLVYHLAAETHVDRSIRDPKPFIQSNILGTFELIHRLESARQRGMLSSEFRFLHVSTDEVYGPLPKSREPFLEGAPYRPSSPYAATKASADHLVHAWSHTYGFPAIITSGCNTYGPGQIDKKLVPVVIDTCLNERPIPVYGDGQQRRSWIFVDDHVSALMTIAIRGRIGEKYNIGGDLEIENLKVVQMICSQFDEMRPRRGGRTHAELIEFIPDRLGHDLRYGMDDSKTRSELGWAPRVPFGVGLTKTIESVVAGAI